MGQEVWKQLASGGVFTGHIVGFFQRRNGERCCVVEGSGMLWISDIHSIRPVGGNDDQESEEQLQAV